MSALASQKSALEYESVARFLSPETPAWMKIIAEGDSWFAYPLYLDVIDHLRRMGYAVEKFSKAGDTLENMVYGTGFNINSNTAVNHGPVSLGETLASVRMNRPRFVLLSAGGNDIVGKEFEQYLNHKNSGLVLFKEDVFVSHVNGYMKAAIRHFLEKVWEENPDTDILMDGYDYARPNGKRYEILSIGVAGPWLLPGFGRKNILDRKQEQEPIIKKLVDHFNSMLADLDQEFERFHYIDLRNLFPKESEWDNEIHLKSQGFKTVAKLYHEKMLSLLPQAYAGYFTS